VHGLVLIMEGDMMRKIRNIYIPANPILLKKVF